MNERKNKTKSGLTRPLLSINDECTSSTCRIQAHLVEMETLLNIQQAISSHLEISDVLQLIADEARKLSSAKYSFLYVLDGDMLTLAALSGVDHSVEAIGFRLPIDKSMAGESILTGEPKFINNIQKDDPRVYIQAFKPFGKISCYLTVPLIYADRQIGVIAVADDCVDTLGEDSLRVLSMLAPSASIGIENARLYQEQQERRMEAESRHQMAESMRVMLEIVNSNKSLEELLDFIVASVGHRLLGCQSMVILGLNSKDETLFIQAAHGLPESQIRPDDLPGIDAALKSIQTRSPLAVSNSQTEETLRADHKIRKKADLSIKEHLLTKFRSWMVVPFVLNHRDKGVIYIYYSEPRTFSNEEINLALMFGNEVALAITNARVHIEAETAAVNAERNRLARELHDAISQTLFSASLITEVIPQLWKKNHELAQEQLVDLNHLIKGALAEMRTLLYELRPAVFNEAKLGDLLGHLTQAISILSQTHISLTVEGYEPLSSDVQMAFYRITQESLNNVIKHSQAQKVDILLHYMPDRVRLLIKDDGRGFSSTQVSPGHFGLNMMNERASDIGATVKVVSKPGSGTEIEVIWKYPLPRQ